MEHAKPSALFVFFILTLGVSIVGCNVIAPPATQPTVRIVSPPQGAQVVIARQVQVMASAQDPNGIVRLELWADGAQATALQPPSPQTDYTVLLPWEATAAGAHSLRVRAVNQSGASTDSIVVTVNAAAESNTVPAPIVSEPPLPTSVALPVFSPTTESATATSTSPSATVPLIISTLPSTSPPLPKNTPESQIAPGLYVTAIHVDPPDPKSTPAQFVFRVTFLNSTGAPAQIPRWRVLIFRPGAKKAMGDPRGVPGEGAQGTSEQVTQPWKIKVMGCEPFYGKLYREDEGGRQTPWLKPDGQELTVSFQVCS